MLLNPFLKISCSRTVSLKTDTCVLCREANLGLHANAFPLIEAGLCPAWHWSPGPLQAIDTEVCRDHTAYAQLSLRGLLGMQPEGAVQVCAGYLMIRLLSSPTSS